MLCMRLFQHLVVLLHSNWLQYHIFKTAFIGWCKITANKKFQMPCVSFYAHSLWFSQQFSAQDLAVLICNDRLMSGLSVGEGLHKISAFKQAGGKPPSTHNWNQHSVWRQRPLSICRNWPVGAREHYGLWGLIANRHATPPRAIHVHCSSVLYASGSLGRGAPIIDAGCLPFPCLCALSFGSLFPSACKCASWLWRLALVLQGAQLSLCSSHSSGFRLQRCWNSWPYSWIHLLATKRDKKMQTLFSYF